MPEVDFAALIEHLRLNMNLAVALPDEATCRGLFAAHRFRSTHLCRRCGNGDGRITDEGWRCRVCGLRIGLTAGTALHATHLPLRIWFAAIWWLTCTPTGIAARRFHHLYCLKSLGTTWRLLHRVRRIVRADRAHAALHVGGPTRAAVQVLGRRCPDNAATVGIDATSSTLQIVIGEECEAVVAALGGEHEPRTARVLLESFCTWISGTFHGVSRNHLHMYAFEFFARLRRPLSLCG